MAGQVLPPMMEEEMIKWFIDNLKPSYYKKMISAPHFKCLIPIGEHIDEGIRSKKIVDPKALSFMIEQQVKKATGCKGKEAEVHLINKTPKRSRHFCLYGLDCLVQSTTSSASLGASPSI